MANPQRKVATNVNGAWYVDCECIDCDLCRTTAPDNFRANVDEGFSYVFKQPENETELALCQQALEECPVEAIGSDAVSTGDSLDAPRTVGDGAPHTNTPSTERPASFQTRS